MKDRIEALVGIAAVLIFSAACLGQWSGSMLLNEASESPLGDVKKPEVCAAAGGGYHLLYRQHLKSGAGTPMKYRRYQGGALGPVRIAANVTNYAWDQYICEAGNGDLHISWEHWDATPDTGWTKSSDGGLTFLPFTEITNLQGSAKAPRITPVGPTGGPDVLLVVADPYNKRICFDRYNGTSWAGVTPTGYGCANVDQAFGICRSPTDGSVFAGTDSGTRTVTCLQYTGSWSATDIATTPDFFARQALAANSAGQVMMLWEMNSTLYGRLYTPGTGWAPQMVVSGNGSFASVIAIPGTNRFYTAYTAGSTPLYIRGREWNGSSWGSEEVISVGLPNAQALTPRVAMATDGSMLCCWEWWGNGGAEAWYSIRSAPPALPRGTLAGTVRDQFGVGVSGAGVNTSGSAAGASGPGGAYSMSVPVGTYSVSANKAYYGSQVLHNIVINENQTTVADFVITGSAPDAASGFSVTSASTRNTLSWTNPYSGQFTGTRIVFRTDHYPVNATDGSVLADHVAGSGSQPTLEHSGLANGTTYYYAAFAYFQDASRFYAAPAQASGTPAVRVDRDKDGDVDQEDFGRFQVCLSGSSTPQNNPACSWALLDADNDVDQDDFAVLRRCFSGPGGQPDAACAN